MTPKSAPDAPADTASCPMTLSAEPATPLARYSAR